MTIKRLIRSLGDCEKNGKALAKPKAQIWVGRGLCPWLRLLRKHSVKKAPKTKKVKKPAKIDWEQRKILDMLCKFLYIYWI